MELARRKSKEVKNVEIYYDCEIEIANLSAAIIKSLEDDLRK